MTSRLNQDVLENQFSIYRQKGGYSKNPTVRTFQAAFKSNLIMNLMRPVKTSNCEPEHSTTLLNLSDFTQIDIDDPNSSENELQDDDSEITSSVSSESSADYKFTLEESSIMYFAGYLIKKCLDKFNCSECKKELINEERNFESDNNLLLFYKDYNVNEDYCLKYPSKVQHEFTHIAMKRFSTFISKRILNKRLNVLAMRNIERKILSQIVNWYDCCETHKKFMLNLLIRTLIYKYCKSYSLDNASLTTGTARQKLRILKNS